jgi:hypothetical protein
MEILTKAILASSFALAMVGCILPVPHIRQHIHATQGIVVDSDTGKPIPYSAREAPYSY